MALNSTEKLLTILMAFTPHNQNMGNVELSQKLDMNVSTVNRLLQVLVSFELVRQDARTKRYSLGRSAAVLGGAIAQSISSRLVSIAQPHMEALRDEVGESVSLEVLKGGYSTILTQVLGPPPLCVSFNVGERMPLHVAAGAKAILAFSSSEVLERYLSEALVHMSENKIKDPAAFRKQLGDIYEKGIALDAGEENADVHALGAPVFDYTGGPVAAVCLCAPSNRMQRHLDSGVIAKIMKASEQISSELLYAKSDT